MTRLERSLALLVRVNEERFSRGEGPSSERLIQAERDLMLHDADPKSGQLPLLEHEAKPVPPKPNACEDCGARMPAFLATTKEDGSVLWLCVRCRDGRLPEDERRALEAHARANARRSSV